MSHAQSHHPSPLGRRLPVKREISTHWQAGWFCLMYDKQFSLIGGGLLLKGVIDMSLALINQDAQQAILVETAVNHFIIHQKCVVLALQDWGFATGSTFPTFRIPINSPRQTLDVSTEKAQDKSLESHREETQRACGWTDGGVVGARWCFPRTRSWSIIPLTI